MTHTLPPEKLSRQLRRESTPHLRRRRGVVCMSLTAMGCMGLIVAYQTGLVRRLPEPDWPGLDADKVDASDEAYARFAMPDAALGLASYAVTLGLAAMGGKDRARSHPWMPIALAVKAGVDAAEGARLSYDQYAKHRAACMWCLIAASATFVSAALVVPEARAAIAELQRRRHADA